ncbi:MAG: flagellar biosynthetic protein FliR, partial [Pseudomonadota bacterium]
MDLIAPLLDVAEGAFLAGAIVFLRIGGAMALLPAFGELTLSVRVKLGLALALTVIVAPVVAREVAMPGWD